ncbi:MAG: PqqD family protein [Bacteroidales bacterium]|nr:PqqD family protein [Bacteroidales bacterium]
MRLKRNIAISESGFLFDPSAGESYSLNEQGIEIINMLREGKTGTDITDYFTLEYEVERDDFERYLVDFTGMLKQFKLVEGDE